MKLVWEIDSKDIQTVVYLIQKYSDNFFVKNRISRNIEKIGIVLDKPTITEQMISCLLTTQQRSGPDRPVSKFISQKPFPVSYEICKNQNNLEKFVTDILFQYGGIRRFNIISSDFTENFKLLEKGLWEDILYRFDGLLKVNDKILERETAEYIEAKLKGFGPKQSRNLLQALGLTKFEIPIDSRIIKWLNNFGFPIMLSSSALSDRYFYNFVSDGIQELSDKANVFPCVLDASIFVSFDKDKWTPENIIL